MKIMVSNPTVLDAPKIVSISHYTVLISMSFWEPARVYGIIRPYSDDPKPFST
jgi:hypothetical protein